MAQLARTVLHAAGEAFHINQQEVFLTVSIGIALCPRDAENVIDLIRNADAAMYYSKQNGGNTFAFYSPEMNAAAVERLMLKSKLRRAVERDEFVVRYQPKVDLRDGRVVGAEALLRWRLPGHGDIPPSQFIPIAEENNLISAIGEWVLERVCMDFRALRRHIADPGRISLNLSLKQLKQASFILNCRSVFERHQVPTRNLELEITETTLMADPRRTVQMLNQLHDMGLHLSIDDFGTGYSSLSALQQFPIGTLKIDQSFVRDAADDPADAVLVRTIIDMGHSLGMEVVAEGVESVRQLEFLRDSRCNFAQGQLFGQARSIDELLQLLQAQQGGRAAFANLVPASRRPRRYRPDGPAKSVSVQPFASARAGTMRACARFRPLVAAAACRWRCCSPGLPARCGYTHKRLPPGLHIVGAWQTLPAQVLRFLRDLAAADATGAPLRRTADRCRTAAMVSQAREFIVLDTGLFGDLPAAGPRRRGCAWRCPLRPR